ncbi:MAG: hypothetical protein EAY75_09645 [Bacteroidetes bacterium]|nr:MAG: hypothetical protein EAY75_09645 [Bacteroidota bacterium]
MNPTVQRIATVSLAILLVSTVWQSAFGQESNPLINSGELLKKGSSLHDEGKYKEAIALYKQINRSDTNYADALYELSLSYYADSQHSAALDHAKLGLALFPEKTTLYSLSAANALDDLKRPDEALAMYDAALSKDPHASQILFNKGITLFNLGRRPEAKATLQKSVLVNPYYSSSHYFIGKMYLEEGNLVAAMLAYKTYLLTAPSGKYVSKVVTDLVNISKVSDEVQQYAKNRKKGPDNFDFLQQILLSKIALEKQYALKADLEDNIVRQIQVVDEKLEYKKSDTGFAMQYYVPLFSKLFQEGDFEAMVFTLFSGLKIDKVTTWNKKNKKKLDVFVAKTVEYLNEIKATQELNLAARKTVTNRYLYENGSLVGKGVFTRQDNNTILSGPWEFYYNNGALRSKGVLGTEEKKQGLWQYYYANGQIKEKITFKDDNRDGFSEGWFEDGVKWYTNNHKAGLAEGLQTVYFFNGLLRSETVYANDEVNGTEKLYNSKGYLETLNQYVAGKQNGLQTTYFSSGAKQTELAYKDGKASGPLKVFYANGQLKSDCNYVDDKKQGLWTSYYENGVVKEKTTYLDNEITGEFTEYFESGKLSRRGTYAKKEIDGKLEVFDEDGKLASSFVYDRGKLREVNFYDKTGAIINSTTTRNGAANIVFYSPEGIKQSEGFFNKEGSREGRFTDYYTNGKIKSVSENKKGVLEGTFRSYFLTGALSYEERYENDEEHGYYKGYFSNGKMQAEGWRQEGEKQQTFIFYNVLGDTTAKEYFLNGELDGYSQYLRPNKTLEYEYKYTTGWLQSISQFDSVGKLLHTSTLKSGNGKLIYKHYNNNTRVEANYEHYMLNGIYKAYFFDGSPHYIRYYKNDEPDSLYKEYTYGGKLKTEGRYKNGEKIGEWKHYSKDGSLFETEFYKDGKLEGTDKFFNKDGTLDLEVTYKNGQTDGHCKYYGEKNQLAVVLNYEKGFLKSYTYENAAGKLVPPIPLKNGTGTAIGYYANGTKSAELAFLESTAHGIRKMYFSNGKVYEDGNRELGLDNGELKTYYPNGNLRQQQTLVLGNLQGIRKFYYPSGKLERTEHYYDDDLHGATQFFDEQEKLIKTHHYYYGILTSIK